MSGQRVILCEKRIKWYLPFWNTEITLSLQSLFVNDFFSRQSGNICEQHDFQICFKIFTNMATIHGKPLMSLRVVDLKDELEKRGLSKSGAKGALVQRLEEYILEHEVEDRDDAPAGGDSAEPPSVQIDTNLEDNPMIREYMMMRENQFKTAMVEKVEAKSQPEPTLKSPPHQKVIESDEEDAPLIKSKKESPSKRKGRGASEAATERMATALALEALDDDEEEVIQKYPRTKRARGSSETEVKSPTMKSPTMKSPTMKSPSHVPTSMKSPSHVPTMKSPSHVVQNLSTPNIEQPIAKIEKSPLKKSPAYEPTSFKTSAPSPSLASPKKVIEQPAPLKIDSPKKTPSTAQEVVRPAQEPKIPAASEQKTPISEEVSMEQTPKERRVATEISEKSATKEIPSVMESPSKKQILAAEVPVPAKKFQMHMQAESTKTPPSPQKTTITDQKIKEIEQPPRPLKTESSPKKPESPKKLPPPRSLSPEDDKEPEDAVDEIVVSEAIVFDEKEKDDDEEDVFDQEEVSSVSAEKREPVTSFRKLSRLGSMNQNTNENPRKKRTWGDSKKTKSGLLDTTAVSSSELKDIVPDIAPVLEELKEEESRDNNKKMDTTDDHVVTTKAPDNNESVSPVTTETNEKNSLKMATSAALPKPIVEDPEDIKGKLAPVSEKNKNQSCVVEIRNLVRPFTNSQLISLLKRTGAFDENEHFWIDKIKSHAMVKFEQPQEAEETVLALDGVKWPSSNQKKLIVTFTSEDHFERQSKEPVSLKQRQHLTSVESGGRGSISGDRDLDGRIQVKRRASESTERHEEKRARKDSSDRHHRGDKEEEKSPKKEQKSLEVLFNKTKALPSIYWLPKS